MMRVAGKIAGVISVLALGIGAVSSPTHAATIATFTNCAVTGGCGSPTTFGTVDLTGNLLTVTLTGPYQFFTSGSGAQPVFAFNTSAGPTSVTGISLDSAADLTYNAGPTPPGNPPSGGIGGMNNFITTTTHNTPLGQSLSFTLNGAFSFINNGGGNAFAAAVFTTVSGIACTGISGGGPTGWIGAPLGSVSQVPLPPAALLFGTALVGLGVLGRRRKNGLVQG